jgi:hypothetical protein
METTTWHILDAHVKLIIKLDQMIDFDNILMVQSAKKFSFLSKERNYLIGSFFFFQHFDRHYLITW